MPMAVASPEKLSAGDVGVGEDEERERADAEARQMSDEKLREKMQRAQTPAGKSITARLPDGGRKLRVTRDAIQREFDRRRLGDRAAPAHHDGIGCGARTRAPDDERCERIVQSTCAESSALASDFNKSKVTKVDFQRTFGMVKKVRIDRCLEITSRSPGETKTSGENEGQVHEEKDSCKPSSQANNTSHERLHLDNSAKMEITSDDASKDNGYNLICTPSPTPRKRKGTAPCFSMRLRSRKEEVVLLDGDTPHRESADGTSNKWDAEKLYYPSREHPHSVEISHDDIKCLQPESLLSSPIMNFYIMYLQDPMSPVNRPRDEYHIFNTYFYSKLEALTSKEDKTSYFLKLRRWWKGVDIFRKPYIMLPVHAETHWSLVIVCMPPKEVQTGPTILHLDSLKLHSSRLIFSVVSRFLKEEWNYLNQSVSLKEFPLQQTVWKNLPRKIEKKMVEVPQQKNEYDCGLFVLYYMHRFIQEAPERLQKKDISLFGKGWFQPDEPSHLRLEIHCLLQLCRKAESENDVTELPYGEAESKIDATEPSYGEAESKIDATEPSYGEAASKKDTTEPLFGETQSKNDAREPLCTEAECKDDATMLMSEHMSEADDVAAAQVLHRLKSTVEVLMLPQHANT